MLSRVIPRKLSALCMLPFLCRGTRRPMVQSSGKWPDSNTQLNRRNVHDNKCGLPCMKNSFNILSSPPNFPVFSCSIHSFNSSQLNGTFNNSKKSPKSVLSCSSLKVFISASAWYSCSHEIAPTPTPHPPPLPPTTPTTPTPHPHPHPPHHHPHHPHPPSPPLKPSKASLVKLGKYITWFHQDILYIAAILRLPPVPTNNPSEIGQIDHLIPPGHTLHSCSPEIAPSPSKATQVKLGIRYPNPTRTYYIWNTQNTFNLSTLEQNGRHFADDPFRCIFVNERLWILIKISLKFLRIQLTHWGRVTHLCVSKLAIIGSDNGLSPDWCQAIFWTNAGILLIGPLGTNFSEFLMEILTFPFKKMRLKVSSAKRRPFCLGLNVLTITQHWLR